MGDFKEFKITWNLPKFSRIQKAPGYDEEDLSTIRTITERIK